MAHKGMKGSKGSAYAKGEKMPMQSEKGMAAEMKKMPWMKGGKGK